LRMKPLASTNPTSDTSFLILVINSSDNRAMAVFSQKLVKPHLMVYFSTIYGVLVSYHLRGGIIIMATYMIWWLPMNFSTQLILLRKERSLTQQQLADAVSLHVNQIKRYEAGTTQPTLDALVKLSKSLHTSLDALVFGDEERGPDESLKYQFEAIGELENADKMIIREVLEGLIIKYQAKRWSRISAMSATRSN
jgi:transcriptional regulator with XRE-family HTH domain